MTPWKLFAILAFLSALCAPAFALTPKQFNKIAAEAFDPVIKQYDIPGLAVGVTLRGQHYLFTYGHTSRESDTKVTGNTIFELGSVSKTFNVTLAALAAERGLLALDRPVSAYLPQLRASAFDKISLMDLATHTTGGLPLQVPDAVTNEEELFKWLSQWRPRDPSRPLRSYSNVSIGLLGKITASALGKSYKEAAEGMLFPMLGLRSTWIEVPASAEGRYAYGYSLKSDKPIRVNPGVLDAEAYGVKSTAEDMLRVLDINLGGGGKENRELRKAIAMTHEGRTETAYFTQDMIWEQYPWPVALDRLRAGNGPAMALKSNPVKVLSRAMPPQRNVLLNKTGSTNGFGTYVAILPAEDLGVVVLANRNYPNEARVEATYRLIRMLEGHME